MSDGALHEALSAQETGLIYDALEAYREDRTPAAPGKLWDDVSQLMAKIDELGPLHIVRQDVIPTLATGDVLLLIGGDADDKVAVGSYQHQHESAHWRFLTPREARNLARELLALAQDIEDAKREGSAA